MHLLDTSIFDVDTSEANVRAVQVADDAACLNSGDCFILTLEAKEASCAEDETGVVTKRPPSDPRVLVWVGAGSSAAERECAAREVRGAPRRAYTSSHVFAGIETC